MTRFRERLADSLRWTAVLAILAVLPLAGCTQEEAAVFGKLLFATMIVALVAIPIVFWRQWKRRGKA